MCAEDSRTMIGRESAAILEVSCPTCAAAPGTPCVSSEGTPRYLSHLARCHVAAVGSATTHGGMATLVAAAA